MVVRVWWCACGGAGVRVCGDVVKGRGERGEGRGRRPRDRGGSLMDNKTRGVRDEEEGHASGPC